jgi:hypothetical protein
VNVKIIKPFKSNSQHQREFIAASERECLLLGGYGSGKTAALVAKHLKLAFINTGCDSIIVCPTMPQAKKTVIPHIENLLALLEKDVEIEENKTDKMYRIPSVRHRIWVQSGDHPDSLKGSNLSHASIDEPFIQNYDVFKQVVARIREPKAKQQQLNLSGTPEGLNWGYSEFILKAAKKMSTTSDDIETRLDLNGTVAYTTQTEVRGKMIETSRRIILGQTYQNPDVSDEYIASMDENYSDAEKEMYLKAKFRDLKTEGAIFQNFSKYNLCEIPYQTGYPLFIDFDYNKSPMTAIISQVLPKAVARQFYPHAKELADKVLCQIDEIYLFPVESDVMYENAGIIFVKRYREHKGEIYVGGDASGKAKLVGTMLSPFEEAKRPIIETFGYEKVNNDISEKNPEIGHSVKLVNGAFQNLNKVSILIDMKCQFSRLSYSGTKWKNGTDKIDKSIDNLATFDREGKSNSPTTHPSDLLRYRVLRFLKSTVTNEISITTR